jgi:hypothetical protein
MVHIDVSTLRPRPAGPMLGRICFTFPDRCVPDPDWNDFILPVLTRWVVRIDEIARCRAESGVLEFMDGPYYLDVERRDAVSVHVSFVERQTNRDVILDTAFFNLDELVSAVMRAAGTVIEAVRNRGLDDDDLELLERAWRAAASAAT